MPLTDAPRIVTARLGHDDSHTLERYLATGGYDGLRKALTMTPEAVAAEVDAASLLGRGGAGFPAGRKWSMLRKDPVTYLVVNGDESEPATFKDHLLIERDPHQIIEGVDHRRLRPAGDARSSSTSAASSPSASSGWSRRSTTPTATARVGRGHLRLGLLARRGRPPRRRAPTSAARRPALLESLEGKRGFPRIKPPYFPAVIGLYGEPTVVNNVETMSNLPWIVPNGGRRLRRARARAARPAPGCSPCRATCSDPGVYEVEMVKTTFRDLIYDAALGGGIRDGRRRSRPSSPAGCPRRGSVPTSSTSRSARTRWARPARCSARARSWSWTTTCVGAGGLADHQVLRPRVLRPVHAVPGGRRAGSSGSCTGSSTGAAASEDLDLLLDVCDNISPGLHWPPQQTTICVLGPSIPSSIALGDLDVPRRVPRPHQRRRLPL